MSLQDSLPEGWYEATPQESDHYYNELQIELSEGHLLYSCDVSVVAHRDGATDDILCQYENELDRFIVIHLTWKQGEETSPHFPSVEVDGTFADFLEYENMWGTVTADPPPSELTGVDINSEEVIIENGDKWNELYQEEPSHNKKIANIQITIFFTIIVVATLSLLYFGKTIGGLSLILLIYGISKTIHSYRSSERPSVRRRGRNHSLYWCDDDE